MRTTRLLSFALLLVVAATAFAQAPPTVTLTEAQLRDHIYGGWLGQAIGVTLGGPWEFRVPWPAPDITYYQSMPTECPDQDDLYIELVTLLALEAKGPDFTCKDIGALWPEYLRPDMIWAANNAAYHNILRGVLPPDSGHPLWNASWDAIDAQIEADIYGLTAPAMVDVAAESGLEGSRVMNWGSGSYGSVFVAACYAAAFTEDEIEQVVRKALAAIPAESEYAGMVRQLLEWKQSGLTWQEARERFAQTYEPRHNGISAIINSGAVIIALLWGEGDFARSIQIGTMCGWDSDCNPSTAGGIVGCMIGAEAIPAEWKDPLHDTYGNHWAIPKLGWETTTFTTLADRTWAVAQRFLEAHGAQRATTVDGVNVWVIPQVAPKPAPLEEATPELIAQWRADRLSAAVEQVAPGWKLSDCGPDMDPGLRSEYLGRQNVLVIHPLDRKTSAKLTRTVRRGEGPARLRLTVSAYDAPGCEVADYVLRVRAGDKVVLEETVGRPGGKAEWRTFDLDLSDALKPDADTVLTIEDAPNGWAWEAAFIAEVELTGLQ
jgi:hypothetical protein